MQKQMSLGSQNSLEVKGSPQTQISLPLQSSTPAQTLDHKLRAMVQTERKITLDILLLIQTFAITQSYLELGFSSLFDYLTQGIGYSEGSAQRRIASAKLLKQVPEIRSEIQDGKINLTQMALAQTAINQQEKSTKQKISAPQKAQILAKLKSKNTFETKRLLQTELSSYDPTPKTWVNPSQDGVSVMLNFTKEQWLQVQELLAMSSHKVPDQKLESLLLRLAEQERRKRLGKAEIETGKVQVKTGNATVKVRKTEEQVTAASRGEKTSDKMAAVASKDRKTDKTMSPPLRRSKSLVDCLQSAVGSRSNRKKYIPAAVRRQVLAKAGNQCQFVSPMTGLRCASRHFLQTEHKMPVSLGGTNSIQNLRAFCQPHNFLAAKQEGVSCLLE